MRPRNFGYSLSSTRMIVAIANWFGLIVAVGLAASVVYFTFINPTSLFDLDGNVLLNDDYLLYAAAILFSGVSLASHAFIINFNRKVDDITFLNNRYILILFSLSIGGVFTPLILMRLPNTSVSSSITPRIAISQGFGVISLAAGIPTLAFLGPIINWTNMFSGDALEVMISAFAIITMVLIAWGIINLSLFSGNNVKERYETSGARGLMVFVSTINLIFGTITLIFIIIETILTIISLIGSLFQRRGNIFSTMLNSMMVSMMIGVRLLVLFTAWNCIKGIWAKENFTYARYEKLAQKEQEYAAEANNV